MAEHVQFRSERMLPEYDQMKKYKLFNDEEIRQIIKMRESFEYKVSRQTKTIKDFCEYIAYERGILSIIAERNRTQNLGLKKTGLENSIGNHIKSLYKIALSRFPEEQRLWDNYIKFCKFCKFIPEVSTIFERMLQYHGDKPTVWLRAVMWEYHEAHNMDRVKNLLLRALQRHPENPDLYIKFFNIMLNEASNMSDEPITTENGEPKSLQSIGLDRVAVVYESSKKKIHNVEFFVQLLHIAQEYKFAKSLQKKLLDDMMVSFQRSEIMWDTLAQCELKGFHICDLSDDKKSSKNDTENNKETENSDKEKNPSDKQDVEMTDANENTNAPAKKTLKRRIELAVKVYETAVAELRTEAMWSLYINAMLELNQDLSTQQVLKRKVLATAFRGAHEANFMSANHYLYYIELLMASRDLKEEYVLEVLKKATTTYCDSVKLWELWMRFHIQRDEETKIHEVFRKATKKLASEAYPLWRLILQYHQTLPNSSNSIESLFRDAIAQNSAAFSSFKPQYVEWTALTKGMIAARMVYKDLVLIPPPCLELHQMMIKFESSLLRPDITEWRKCHEHAIHFFGQKQTDVWINYIKFERDFGEAKNMGLLFERAKMTLSEDLVDNFLSEHSLITNGII